MTGWPHVSLPHGAASAKKDIQKQIPLFQGYEEIVLFFDGDEPGRKAAEEAAGILPPGKVKIARLEGYKDPSEALQAKDPDAIRVKDDFFNDLDISNVKKLILRTKPSNFKSFISNNISKGIIKGSIDLNFLENLELSNYKLNGNLRETDINFFNKIEVNNAIFNFIAD